MLKTMTNTMAGERKHDIKTVNQIWYCVGYRDVTMSRYTGFDNTIILIQ